jgi:hypothetical protein
MKTGLSSLNAALQHFGFDVRQRDRRNWLAFKRGDFAAVMRHYETADAFMDWPHPYMYRPFLDAYGDRARFVLTIREPDDWYESLLRHNRYAHPVLHSHRYHFGRYYPHGFPAEHKDVLIRHNERAIAFFRDQGREDQLLVLETKAGDAAARLSRFLDQPEILESYPHKNISDKREWRGLSDTIRGPYNELAQQAYARLARHVAPLPGRHFAALEDLQSHVFARAGRLIDDQTVVSRST